MEREIKFTAGETLESAVHTLLAAKARGEKVYGTFNGHILHSDTVSMDSAYMEVLGCTKEEHDQRMQEWHEQYEKEQREAEARAMASIPKWIERGKAFIFPERQAEWERCVRVRASDLYNGLDLENALDIMEALEAGATIEQAKQMFDAQNHSGASASMVRSMLFSFSSQGPEFWEATSWGEIKPEDREALEAKKQENAQLKAAHAAENTNGDSPKQI